MSVSIIIHIAAFLVAQCHHMNINALTWLVCSIEMTVERRQLANTYIDQFFHSCVYNNIMCIQWHYSCSSPPYTYVALLTYLLGLLFGAVLLLSSLWGSSFFFYYDVQIFLTCTVVLPFLWPAFFSHSNVLLSHLLFPHMLFYHCFLHSLCLHSASTPTNLLDALYCISSYVPACLDSLVLSPAHVALSGMPLLSPYNLHTACT